LTNAYKYINTYKLFAEIHGLVQLAQESYGGYCKHGNKTVGSVEIADIPEQLGAVIFTGTVFVELQVRIFFIMSLSFILF
jgi:hypothetical protein